MIKTKCLFGDKKIIFYPSLSLVNCLIIANINSKNEFNSELLLYYDNSKDLENHINQIKQIGYGNIFSNLNFINKEVKILLKENSSEHICTVYDLKKDKTNLVLKKEIEEELFNIIKIYLFNLDLKNKISLSMNYAGNDNYNSYIKTEDCYMINKEWMDEYKEYYLYNELSTYLNKEEIKKRIKPHYKGKNCYNELEENVIRIYDEIKDDEDLFKKYYNLSYKLIDANKLILKEKNLGKKDKNNKEIKYYDEFALINSELKSKLIINKYKKIEGESKFIINMATTIIFLDYYPLYQILICALDEEKFTFKTLAFIQLENSQELNYQKSLLKSSDFKEFQQKIIKNNNKIYNAEHTREVGELYNVNETPKKDIIENLIELYLAFDNLNFYIKELDKTILSKENYYLINKEWINYLNSCYGYDQINNIINGNINNMNIIKKYRYSNEIVFDSNDIIDIKNQIPEETKICINNKDKKKYDINLFKSFEKNIKADNNVVFYYDNCILINDKIKNILSNINGINDKFDIDVNCFIDSSQIFILYKKKNKLKENYIMSIGKAEENNTSKICLLKLYLKIKNR